MTQVLQGYILNCYFSLSPLKTIEIFYSHCLLASKASSEIFSFTIFHVFTSPSLLLAPLPRAVMYLLNQIYSHVAKDIFASVARV